MEKVSSKLELFTRREYNNELSKGFFNFTLDLI